MERVENIKTEAETDSSDSSMDLKSMLLQFSSQITSQLNEQLTVKFNDQEAKLTDKFDDQEAKLEKQKIEITSKLIAEIKQVSETLTADVRKLNEKFDQVEVKLQQHASQFNTLESQMQNHEYATNQIVNSIEKQINKIEGDCKVNCDKNRTDIITLTQSHQKQNSELNSFKMETQSHFNVVEKKIENINTTNIEAEMSSLKAIVTNIRETTTTQNFAGIMPNHVYGGAIPVRCFPSDNLHPIDFIQNCKDSFVNVMTDSTKIKFVKRLLEGEALTWANENCTSWETFEEFEQNFLNKFWSKSEQARIKSDFLNGSCYRERYGGLVKFCRDELKKLAHLRSSFDTTTIIDTLTRRLPERLHRELVNAPVHSVDDFLNYLNKFERVLDREHGGKTLMVMNNQGS